MIINMIRAVVPMAVFSLIIPAVSIADCVPPGSDSNGESARVIRSDLTPYNEIGEAVKIVESTINQSDNSRSCCAG